VRTRGQYDQALAICRDAIAHWDPFALLAGGAPPDEYNAEVSSLVPKLSGARSGDDVARAIEEVFGSGFGRDQVYPGNCAKVAAIVYAQLKAAGLLTS
jgi:hypothetical protein